LLKVLDVFSFAQKSVLYPLEPLYFRDSKILKPRFARALKRIFILSDRDRDGSLNNAELNDFQVLLFPSHIKHSLIISLFHCRLTRIWFVKHLTELSTG
jgi:mitochondrial Rho GTPase 1